MERVCRKRHNAADNRGVSLMTIPATPKDPIVGVLDAFNSNDLVALCDGGHGCEQAYSFRISLLRDSRFSTMVNDIVVESGNALYQSMMDRFVSGEDVPRREFRKVWQNTTQPHDVWDRPIFEGLFREVRELNMSLSRDRQIRILLGDPPIDWSKINNAVEFHQAWNALKERDIFAAKMIEREVLAKQRRALIIYGGMHLLRKRLFWQSKDERIAESQSVPFEDSIVSLLERKGAHIYSIWTPVFVDITNFQPDICSWQIPSLVDIQGTPLGEASFRSYYPHAMFTRLDGKMVEIYVDTERSPVMEEQFNAILYLGPPSNLTWSQTSPALAADPEYIKMRSERLAWFGQPL
jgi:hypothetical protein